MAAPLPSGAQATDAVTDLQFLTAELATVMFDALGCLQRDAPTQSPEVIATAASQQAARLAALVRTMESAIDRLPTATAEEQYARLAACEERSQTARADVLKERERARQSLSEIQGAIRDLSSQYLPVT